jgi:hypothetical protein
MSSLRASGNKLGVAVVGLGDGPIFDFVSRERMASFLGEDMTPNPYSKFLFSFVSAKMFLEHHRDWRP